MDLNSIELDKIIGYAVPGLVGAAFAYLRKMIKDLNASFYKIRTLEDQVKELREWKMKSEERKN